MTTIYDSLVSPLGVQRPSTTKAAGRLQLSETSSVTTLDNGKPGGAIILATLAKAVQHHRGSRILPVRKAGASSPHEGLSEVAASSTAVIAALGD